MKVLLINGSPKANGNTAIALNEMIKVFNAEGVETELIHVGNKDIRGCIACGKCFESGKCVFDDVVNEVLELLLDLQEYMILCAGGTIAAQAELLLVGLRLDGVADDQMIRRVQVEAADGGTPVGVRRQVGCDPLQQRLLLMGRQAVLFLHPLEYHDIFHSVS